MNSTRDKLNAAFLNLPIKAFFAATKTDPVQIESLFRKLAPRTTDKPLIRLGPRDDGGYLVLDDLAGITTCFSPGVSTVSGFELECASRGMDVFLADASVEAPPDNHPKFKFIKNFIGAINQDPFITMEEWVTIAQPDHSDDWLLQIDIEGSEYEVFLNMPTPILEKFRAIVVEFHFLDYLFDLPFFMLASRAFERLLTSHVCVHIHPNNADNVISCGDIRIPKTMEFTFHRRDRIQVGPTATRFPHALDFDNVSGAAPQVLPSCWYKL